MPGKNERQFPQLPPGRHTQDLPTNGSGQGTPGRPSERVLQGPVSAKWQACMPVPRLCWRVGIRLDDEATLLRHTPKRFGYCAKGATVPTLHELQHASEPCLPKAYLHQRMRNGHGGMPIARSGSGICSCPFSSVHGTRDALNKVEIFEYLGTMMAQDNNHTQAVRHQLVWCTPTWIKNSEKVTKLQVLINV
jgi:hypothetical protein